jgi:hypothetical protein
MTKLFLWCIFVICFISSTVCDDDIDPVTITEFYNESDENSYQFRFGLSDGQSQEENGTITRNSRYCSHDIIGILNYIGNDGEELSIKYSAILKTCKLIKLSYTFITFYQHIFILFKSIQWIPIQQ